ncbi:PREDICTED: actin-binding protein anillin isoform X1 [Bactrocera latifrons]|uniref:actin-binding protein anillin isoform X1 n=1 Tax=Bactrocera latifrons TaxID=174628 RepID=UPI0008DCF490|nr:PREDICTED: actin-binding protein anillin isoform X1 [Bactrocera latifrons]
MDPFTQRILEKAEQRSRLLGISKASKHPRVESAGEFNIEKSIKVGNVENGTQQKQTFQTQQITVQPAVAASLQATSHKGTSAKNENGLNCNKLEVIEKVVNNTASFSNTEQKVHRQFSAVNKENMDLGIEINIVTNKNMEVEVQVEEQNIVNNDVSHIKTALEQTTSKIRNTSRSCLQRLGALYANPNDLSSPIHRTEGDFHSYSPVDECDGKSTKRSKQRLGKLVELASSINQWEDDTSHHDPHPPSLLPPPKPDLPSRKISNVPVTTLQGTKFSNNTCKEGHEHTTSEKLPSKEKKTGNTTKPPCNTKQLTWDPLLFNSLEAQGFQRRKSSVVKLAYDYTKDEKSKSIETQGDDDIKDAPHQPKVAKLASTFSKILGDKCSMVDRKEHKFSNVNIGLVSGRTAAFEKKVSACQEAQRPQKDPTELSLKERMQLFERNKGEALIPKAALGMAPPISKIHNEHIVQHRGDGAKATNADILFTNENLKSSKPSNESKLREKVAALVSNTSTMAEIKIKSDIQKQRKNDMQVIANRFHKQKYINESKGNILEASGTKETLLNFHNTKNTTIPHPPSPPPPPPMPKESLTMKNKRHSPSEVTDEETKRACKTAVSRLYPALSNLESRNLALESNSGSGATTAIMSDHSTDDEHSQILTKKHETSDLDSMNGDGSDMYSEDADDSSIDICNISLGREIMHAVQKNDDHQKKHQQEKQMEQKPCGDNEYFGCEDSSLNSSETSLGINDYLDEALKEDGIDDDTQGSCDYANESGSIIHLSKENKGTTASNSFSFHKSTKKDENYKIATEENKISPILNSAPSLYVTQPVKSEMSINRENENNMVTLVHTVSFYRRQQSDNSANSTPIRKVSKERKILRSDISNATSAALKIEHKNNIKEFKNDETYLVEEVETQINTLQDEIYTDDTHLVEEKIKKLLDEVCKQQTVIAQTSQALNLCAATIEFSGSTESVEGERHLLVATHRRQACLDEVQRLRVEKCLRPTGSLRDKGRLTVKEITIPLRQDYIRKLAADTISGHHLVCLLKYNEYVLATKTVPTLPGLLAVKFPDVLIMNNVYADFRITLEIYGMTAQREVLPHEVKYHINLNKKCGIKTPKKKGSENRLVMPPVQRPAGPNVVRTPVLVQYGFAIFSLREIQRTSWTLTQVLGVSPLEGVVHMKANCELSVLVEHRGFLTMFEDISGFGAWHRRWCYLNGSVLNYWKYPDDERKKTPIGTIDLYACHTQKVTVAPRDICARLNTMLLEFERPAKETDVESLIIVPNGRNTIVRYLLSADTREERELWCAYFNKVLLLLRAWGPPQ